MTTIRATSHSKWKTETKIYLTITAITATTAIGIGAIKISQMKSESFQTLGKFFFDKASAERNKVMSVIFFNNCNVYERFDNLFSSVKFMAYHLEHVKFVALCASWSRFGKEILSGMIIVHFTIMGFFGANTKSSKKFHI